MSLHIKGKTIIYKPSRLIKQKNRFINLFVFLAKSDKIKFDKLKTLAEILKEARESKGLLLREVAASISADTAMISKFEKGERKPTRDQILALAKALDIDENELLVSYLSDKVVSDLKDEEVAKKALKAAELKIDLILKKAKK